MLDTKLYTNDKQMTFAVSGDSRSFRGRSGEDLNVKRCETFKSRSLKHHYWLTSTMWWPRNVSHRSHSSSLYACGGICVGMDPVYRNWYIQKKHYSFGGKHPVCVHVHGAQNAQHTKRFPFEFLHEAGLAFQWLECEKMWNIEQLVT